MLRKGDQQSFEFIGFGWVAHSKGRFVATGVQGTSEHFFPKAMFFQFKVRTVAVVPMGNGSSVCVVSNAAISSRFWFRIELIVY